ncbi:LysR family transcriptional regulator [Marinobacter sp. F4218]|uniref:LysR family transcriptional regulator n=1 Tax=Marinobacter sp. F4218 TaxID=2862868 RepID=UPI001C62C69C|nr:LysR family transcriptional regulator [Marinobacter sp. F4218]MBW7470764.1 LysR family transcriptional regulator [Marinobacter sp. F4218]
MINPVWLRSFCTLVEVGHFTRTAERLHMTQSGVSQHVRKLEQHLERSLLIRQGKRFTLTDAGSRLYREASAIVESLSDLERRIGADPLHDGVVRIMSPGSVGLKLYPHLLELQRRHPKLVMDYRFAPNADVERAIADYRVDVGIMTSPSSLDEVGFKPVGEEPLLLVTPKNMSEPRWEQLMELGFVDHPDGAHHAGLLLGANYPEFHHSNQFPLAGFSNQISLILQPVSMGLGFTVLPAYAVEAFPARELVQTHRLSKPASETLLLCFRRNQPVANRVRTVIEAMREGLGLGAGDSH